jgi:hypothetical protein
LAYQIDRSVFRFGSWIEGKLNETHEVPVRKNARKNTTIEPKYRPDEIRRFIYGPLPTDNPNRPKGMDQFAYWQNVDPFEVEAED